MHSLSHTRLSLKIKECGGSTYDPSVIAKLRGYDIYLGRLSEDGKQESGKFTPHGG
ncbi:hypothetical protein HMSSN139_16870 [Paenibacillus sp. HMSSN-139]|nr:hypothetical protein HMSSN139_16870 [Paenibacillus sp. HMSSN-139]